MRRRGGGWVAAAVLAAVLAGGAGLTAAGGLALASGLALAQVEPPSRAPSRAPTARRGFTVKITEPADGAIAMGPTRIAAEVTSEEPGAATEVTFYVGEKKIFVDREPPYQTVHDFGTEPKSMVVRAVATHRAGFSVEDSVVTRQLRLSYVVEVRRVRLILSVTDGAGAPVTGLGRESFKVYENGVEQEILDFGTEERPLRLALVLDTSGSMRGELTQVQLAAAGFLDVLRPDDAAMVIDFDDQVLLLQDLTGTREDLRAALMSTFARGGTAMYDAVHAALRRLAPEKERKAVVLLSDGGDTASVFDRDRALEAAKSADVLIYAIGIGGGADKGVLRALAKESGGQAFFADSAAELAGIYQRIADQLRSQYLVTYSSSKPEYDGTWRKVRVDHTGPQGYTVRTRPGYYAVKPPAAPLEAAPASGPPAPEAAPEEEGGSPGAGGEAAAPPAAG